MIGRQEIHNEIIENITTWYFSGNYISMNLMGPQYLKENDKQTRLLLFLLYTLSLLKNKPSRSSIEMVIKLINEYIKDVHSPQSETLFELLIYIQEEFNCGMELPDKIRDSGIGNYYVAEPRQYSKRLDTCTYIEFLIALFVTNQPVRDLWLKAALRSGFVHAHILSQFEVFMDQEHPDLRNAVKKSYFPAIEVLSYLILSHYLPKLDCKKDFFSLKDPSFRHGFVENKNHLALIKEYKIAGVLQLLDQIKHINIKIENLITRVSSMATQEKMTIAKCLDLITAKQSQCIPGTPSVFDLHEQSQDQTWLPALKFSMPKHDSYCFDLDDKHQIAYTCYLQGDYQQAKNIFLSSMNKNDKDILAFYGYLAVLLHAQAFDEAITHINKYLQNKCTNNEIAKLNYILALIYHENNIPGIAKHLGKILKHNTEQYFLLSRIEQPASARIAIEMFITQFLLYSEPAMNNIRIEVIKKTNFDPVCFIYFPEETYAKCQSHLDRYYNDLGNVEMDITPKDTIVSLWMSKMRLADQFTLFLDEKMLLAYEIYKHANFLISQQQLVDIDDNIIGKSDYSQSEKAFQLLEKSAAKGFFIAQETLATLILFNLKLFTSNQLEWRRCFPCKEIQESWLSCPTLANNLKKFSMSDALNLLFSAQKTDRNVAKFIETIKIRLQELSEGFFGLEKKKPNSCYSTRISFWTNHVKHSSDKSVIPTCSEQPISNPDEFERVKSFWGNAQG